MTVKLLTEQHLEFLSLKGGYTGSYESTLVNMPHCWKSHVAAHIFFLDDYDVFRSHTRHQNQRSWSNILKIGNLVLCKVFTFGTMFAMEVRYNDDLRSPI